MSTAPPPGTAAGSTGAEPQLAATLLLRGSRLLPAQPTPSCQQPCAQPSAAEDLDWLCSVVGRGESSTQALAAAVAQQVQQAQQRQQQQQQQQLASLSAQLLAAQQVPLGGDASLEQLQCMYARAQALLWWEQEQQRQALGKAAAVASAQVHAAAVPLAAPAPGPAPLQELYSLSSFGLEMPSEQLFAGLGLPQGAPQAAAAAPHAWPQLAGAPPLHAFAAPNAFAAQQVAPAAQQAAPAAHPLQLRGSGSSGAVAASTPAAAGEGGGAPTGSDAADALKDRRWGEKYTETDLEALQLTDPKRYKRILNNRKSVAAHRARQAQARGRSGISGSGVSGSRAATAPRSLRAEERSSDEAALEARLQQLEEESRQLRQQLLDQRWRAQAGAQDQQQ